MGGDEADEEAESEDRDDQEDEAGDVEESEEESVEGDGLKVFVGNIPWGTEEAALQKHFSKCGEIAKIDRPNKLAFVTFKSKAAVAKALELHGKEVGGEKLKVKVAVERDSKPDRVA